MSNIEYQTKSNIPIIWILNIKLKQTVEFWMSNIEYQTQFNIWLFFYSEPPIYQTESNIQI